MADKAWKQLERDVGDLIGGKRYPANQGGFIDVESTDYVVQVKHRKSLSLEQITQLVEMIEGIGEAKHKKGLVIVKVKRGKGKPSPFLVIQSADQWKQKRVIPKELPLSTELMRIGPLSGSGTYTETERPQRTDPLGPLKST